jgi:hypothetical protein
MALCLLAQCAFGQGPLRLKARTIPPARDGAAPPGAGRVAVLPGRAHYIVQFDSYPGLEIRQELARRGVRVLRYTPDAGLMVRSERDVDLGGLGVSWVGPLEASDKLSPLLDREPAPAYLVMFHPDVAKDRARELVAGQGFGVLENRGLRPGHLVVVGNPARLVDLALRDEVSYILPASVELASGAPVVGCGGGIAEAGVIGEYAIAASAWPKNAAGVAALNYVFESLPAALGTTAQSEIERAFAEWARHANVSFAPGVSAADPRTIAILFARGAHGDAYPFDGLGGVLAHTFYPAPLNAEPVAGDMHFDADESWRIGADTDVFSVALHEIGHALGLGHSDQPGAVMYAYYHLATGLTADDIVGVQALYGPSGGTPAQPSNPPTSNPAQPSNPPVSPPSTDTTPPSLLIASPAYTILSTSSASLSIGGTASDNVAVTAVKWSTSGGYSGVASGTVNWSAQVPLLVGTNVVTVRAYDAAGNSGWRAITVVRR